jgi:hypothetical protein
VKRKFNEKINDLKDITIRTIKEEKELQNNEEYFFVEEVL